MLLDVDVLHWLMGIVSPHKVSPEVLRELEQAVPRDTAAAAAVAGVVPAAAAAARGGRDKISVESRVGQHVTEDLKNLPPVPMMDED
jgi:hypothetical protein